MIVSNIFLVFHTCIAWSNIGFVDVLRNPVSGCLCYFYIPVISDFLISFLVRYYYFTNSCTIFSWVLTPV